MCDSLPNAVVIGAMKCGTTALHRYLGTHPEVAMADAKEVNFFQDPGEWHRGTDWYASLFDADSPVRGESSPGYTSPDHPEVAARMAQVLPDVRLVCLVRDPVDRAVSQYAHHRREGAERRSPEEALLDPASQYLSRGRYHERLTPFRWHFPVARLHVVVQERLLAHRRAQLGQVYAHVGADPDWWHDELDRRWHVAPEQHQIPSRLREALRRRLDDDTERLRELLDDDIPEWPR